VLVIHLPAARLHQQLCGWDATVDLLHMNASFLRRCTPSCRRVTQMGGKYRC
jgi:hypothetical protein